MLASTLSHPSAKSLAFILILQTCSSSLLLLCNELPQDTGAWNNHVILVTLLWIRNLERLAGCFLFVPRGQLGQWALDDPFKCCFFTHTFGASGFLGIQVSPHDVSSSRAWAFQSMITSRKSEHQEQAFQNEESGSSNYVRPRPQTGPASRLPYSIGQNSHRAHLDLKSRDTNPSTQLVAKVCTKGLECAQEQDSQLSGGPPYSSSGFRSPVKKGSWSHFGCLATDPAREPIITTTF